MPVNRWRRHSSCNSVMTKHEKKMYIQTEAWKKIFTIISISNKCRNSKREECNCNFMKVIKTTYFCYLFSKEINLDSHLALVLSNLNGCLCVCEKFLFSSLFSPFFSSWEVKTFAYFLVFHTKLGILSHFLFKDYYYYSLLCIQVK